MSTNPNPGFVPESWSLYSVGVVCIALRVVSRIKKSGINSFQLDDYFVLFGLFAFTLLCVAFNEMLKGAGSNLMTPEEQAALTPQIVEQRVKGSKWVFVSEHAMLLTIWSMKAAMLVLYARVTEGLLQRRILNGVIVWVCLSFLGDELALFTICRPLNQYWAVPPADAQCSTYQYYQIVNAVFNISTDIMLLAIGLPPVLRARLSIQQKIILSVVLGMGSFVIVAAILRAIYCLVPSLISYVYMNWYFREASVAVYVTNAPSIWILLRDVFPGLQRLGKSSKRTLSNNYSKPTKRSVHGPPAYVGPDSYAMETTSKTSWTKVGTSRSLDRDGFDNDETPINGRQGARRGSEVDSEQHATREHSAGDNAMANNVIRHDVTFSVQHVTAQEKV